YISEKDTIALRMPNQKDLLHLIKEAGGVLAVTSANISGEPPISNADDLQKAFSRYVSIIIDGGIQNGTPSTIINCVGDNPSIVRQGSVYIESSMSGD
ncbi:TsaC protein (YrdC domain) required for threonylcarbamoyladenosine t(6)A37 modification in tRNA, partial [hydrothermal vent metagenome]